MLCQVLRKTLFVLNHKPVLRPARALVCRSKRRTVPRWHVEPIVKVRFFLLDSALSICLDPIPLLFKRVGRDRNTSPPLAGIEALPVDLYSFDPELPHGLEHRCQVRPLFSWVGQRRNRDCLPGLLAGQPADPVTRTDIE